jgi:ribosomal protein L9
VSGAALEVTRLLQNPLGSPAPEGARGDIVRVSDGARTIYLTPREFDEATEQQLRYRLAAEGRSRSRA